MVKLHQQLESLASQVVTFSSLHFSLFIGPNSGVSFLSSAPGRAEHTRVREVDRESGSQLTAKALGH